MRIWFECTGERVGVEPTLVEWGQALKSELRPDDTFTFGVCRANVRAADPKYSSTAALAPTAEYEDDTLNTLLEKHRPDVVHCHGVRRLWHVLHNTYIRANRTQLIVTMHSFRHGTALRPFAAMCDAFLFRSFRRTVTPHFLSTRSLDEFYRGLPMAPKLSRCAVFPLGVIEPADVDIQSGPNVDLLKRLREDPTPKVIYLANHHAVKRHLFLLHEMKDSLSAKRCVLILCGEGPKTEAIRRVADKWGVGTSVITPGRVSRPEVWKFLKIAQLGVCSSRSENSPRCVLEPLAQGLPVVTTDVGSASEYVQDFVNGFVVPNVTRRGVFGSRVRLLLENRAMLSSMSDAARGSVIPRFSWKCCSQRTIAMYRAAMSGLV